MKAEAAPEQGIDRKQDKAQTVDPVNLSSGRRISIDIEDDEDSHEFVSALMLTGMGWEDAYTPCGDIHLLWRAEYLTGDATVNVDRDSCQIIVSAANKLMYQLLESHCPDASK